MSAIAAGETYANDASFARRAVVRLSSIEFWERYSFYNMFALLALFVSAPIAKGGMGWSDGDALRFFGVYLLAVQTAPVLGGWLADRWLSGWVALRVGGILLLIGHALLTVPNLIPVVAQWLSGMPILDMLSAARVPLGGLHIPAGVPVALVLPHQLISASFYLAVVFVALGNGLFKPVLTMVVGRLPHAGPAERDSAFTIFFLFINIGGLASTLFGGWLADRYGWGWAFGAAALGMAVAVVTMTGLAPRYIKPFLPAHGLGRAAPAQSGSATSGWIGGVAVLLAIFVAMCAASYQSYGMISLFNAKLVDRSVGGVVIPPAWFTALNPITIMLLTPVLLRTWRRGGLGYDWSATTKFAAGFALMAAAFVPLVLAALQARSGGLASPLWVAATIIVIAGVELLTAPAVSASLTRITPPHRQALVLGLASAAAGLGAWLSGRVGAAALESDVAIVVGLLCAACAMAAGLLFLLRRRLAQRGV